MMFTEPVFRPPQEVDSLLLRLTQGCTHNQCHFCYLSRNYPFRFASPADFELELLRQAPEYRADSKVYLLGANPFALSADKLTRYAEIIRKHVPYCPEISMHARISDIMAKKDGQLRELRRMGITHLYPGTENGSETALRLMNKGVSAREGIEQLQRLDDAGIAYTANYIIGVAGQGRGHVSAVKTAEMFNQTRPRRITTTGLTVFPGTPLADMCQNGCFREAPETEKLEEQMAFVRHLTVETIVDFRHYLNLVNVELRMPERRDDFVRALRDILHRHTDESIAQHYDRRTFVSL